MTNLFILQPKTISQTSLNDWNNLVSRDDVLFTATSDDYGITDDYLNQINCSVYTFSNFNSSGLIEKKAIDLHKILNFSKIISTSEADVLRAARLREHFKLLGQNVRDALLFRDKAKMKSFVCVHGIRIPKFKKITSTTDLIEFIDHVGYDVIIKPNLGGGSANTLIIKNEKQLESLLADGLIDNSFGTPDLIAESFVKGRMYHVDGIVINNKIIIHQPSAYVNTCVEFQNGTHIGSYTLEENNPMTSRLRDLNHQILRILPSPKNFAFHAEYFQDENNQLVFCEIACRPGGGIIKDVLFEKYNINIVTEWMKSEIQNDYELPNVSYQSDKIAGFLLIPPYKGLLKHIPNTTPFEWVNQYRVTAKINSEYKNNIRTSGEIISFLTTSQDENNMIARINTLSSWADENIIWE